MTYRDNKELRFADVICANGHTEMVQAAEYEPPTGKSVWGSAMDLCGPTAAWPM